MVSSATVSSDLKTALIGREFSDHNAINDLRSWWHGDDVFTYLGTLSGYVKAVSDTAKPRLFEQSADITLAWTIQELYQFLTARINYVNHEFSTVNGGLTRRCTITVNDGENDVEFIADQDIEDSNTEQADIEAMAVGVTDLLNDVDFDNYRN